MNRDQVAELLAAGIAAAKEGNRQQAETLLLQVVAADEKNELAWLWLSGQLTADDDRRICLENVLVINPDNQAARRGLVKLDRQAESLPGAGDGIVIQRRVEAISLASAVLYPERQEQSWLWRDGIALEQSADVTFSSRSKYDDVWERDDDICAYCAAEVPFEANHCPNCRRKLTAAHYRYPRASTDLTIYWVLLLGVAQLFFVRVLLDLILRSRAAAVWHGLLFGLMVVLIAGVFLRRFSAYAASLVVLMLLLAGMLLTMVAGSAIEEAVLQALKENMIFALADDPVVSMAASVSRFIVPLQMVAVILALLYGIFSVGPDFERVHSRQIAKVDKGLGDSSQFFSAGQAYAAKEMWANAVLHYQRAAALDPTRSTYQRLLGEAYARLGFYERSLDVLESAQRLARSDEDRTDIRQRIESVQRQQLIAAQEGKV